MAFDFGRVGAAASRTMGDILRKQFEEELLVRRQQEEENWRKTQEAKWQAEAARQAGLDKAAAEQVALQNARQKRADFLATRAPGAVLSPEDTNFAEKEGLGTLLTQVGGETLPSKQFNITASSANNPIGLGMMRTANTAVASVPDASIPITTTFRGTPEYLAETERAAAARAQQDKQREDQQAFQREQLRIQDATRRDIAHAAAQARADTAKEKTDSAAAILDGIKQGIISPDRAGMSRDGTWNRVSSLAAKEGYDLSKAERNWASAKRWIATTNGTQQIRLRQAIGKTDEALGLVSSLGADWNAQTWGPLSRANLKAAKEGYLGPDAQKRAQMLDGQIVDTISELAQVYQSGGVPTDAARKMAEENLQSWWGKGTLDAMVGQARQNLGFQLDAMDNTGPVGLGGGQNPYFTPPEKKKPNQADLRKKYGY